MKYLLTFLTSITLFSATSQDLSYYLPENVTYNPDIPTPKEIIGHEVGEWHITHDRLVNYMKAVADASPRVSLEIIGYTHEMRPQLLLIITSEENHQKIDQIQSEHLKITDPDQSSALQLQNMPAVVLQGFSIHGNEPSGSNASLLTVYHYAASQGEEIEQLLANLVILIDPSFNPDGLQRFSTWVNSRRSKNLIADSQNQEQNEFWPGGRTNHYWFDLNRDWLPVQQPESKNRIAKFHEWKPNVLTDHHEMGTNSTFFFQPGVPSRNNPNTPQNNFVLTEKIGDYHAKALDKIGSLYYSKEGYDDFYYGKGSTFPDINGGIGILFEQASARSHVQESIHGDLTFPFAIRNQFVTSLSTTEAAHALKNELLEHQRQFFINARKEAQNDPNQGVLFGNINDDLKASELAKILKQHKIEVFEISSDASISGQQFISGNCYYVPFDQNQYKLIKTMFETVISFQDSLFYDVSSWTLPMAFGLNYEFIDSKNISRIKKGNPFGESEEKNQFQTSDYAYAINWGDYFAPSVLDELLDNGIRCKAANEEFYVNEQKHNRGTILIPLQNQEKSKEEIHQILTSLSNQYGVPVTSISTGMTAGVNLGSRTFDDIENKKIALLVEDGVRSYDAGEIWHLLDNRMNIELSLIPTRTFGRTDLAKYNVLLMADGNYNSLTAKDAERIKDWVSNSGTIVSIKNANRWLNTNKIIDLEYVPSKQVPNKRTDYEYLGELRGGQATGGAIFKGDLDITNPIGYGYDKSEQHVFVNSNAFIKTSSNPYADIFVFDQDPLASGYISEENLERLQSTSGIKVSRVGRGRVVSFSFNPNFRAFWYGTNALFLNSIYFADMISSSATN